MIKTFPTIAVNQKPGKTFKVLLQVVLVLNRWPLPKFPRVKSCIKKGLTVAWPKTTTFCSNLWNWNHPKWLSRVPLLMKTIMGLQAGTNSMIYLRLSPQWSSRDQNNLRTRRSTGLYFTTWEDKKAEICWTKQNKALSDWKSNFSRLKWCRRRKLSFRKR